MSFHSIESIHRHFHTFCSFFIKFWFKFHFQGSWFWPLCVPLVDHGDVDLHGTALLLLDLERETNGIAMIGSLSCLQETCKNGGCGERTVLLLLQLCALLPPGEEAPHPQVPVSVLQQGLGHVSPVQRLDGDGVGERVALKNRTFAENITMSKPTPCVLILRLNAPDVLQSQYVGVVRLATDVRIKHVI